MSLYWNPWSVAGILAIPLGWTLATLIYRRSAGRLQTRALAVFMVLASSAFGIGVGIMFAANDAATALALQTVALAAFYASGPVYLLFLSTLPTRVTAWLRPAWVRGLLMAASPTAALLVVVNFDALVAGVIEVPYARQDAYFTSLGTRLFETQAIVTATLGVAAAVGVWMEAAKGSAARRQARWYAATFVVWEVLQLTSFTLLEIAFRSATPRVDLYTVAVAILLPAAILLLLLMLGYSILSTQLFDIDLKVKFAVEKSTIIAAFAIAFIVASELVERLLGVDGRWFGLAAAVVVGLLFRRVEDVASRAADRLMPGVRDTEEYRMRRKQDVYRAAFEQIKAEAALTARDQEVLAELAEKLGLSSEDARAVERQAGNGAGV